MLLAWEKKLDKDKNDRLDLAEFDEALKSIGSSSASRRDKCVALPLLAELTIGPNCTANRTAVV